jgi:hypothetical protein
LAELKTSPPAVVVSPPLQEPSRAISLSRQAMWLLSTSTAATLPCQPVLTLKWLPPISAELAFFAITLTVSQ